MAIQRPFRKLASQGLPAGVPVLRYEEVRPSLISTASAAIDVMTDLRYVRVITVDEQRSIDDALQVMINAGVRLLVVTGRDGEITGLITSRDINGEKPVDFVSRHRVSRGQVTVADIMTSRGQIDVLNLADVTNAQVGDIVVTLREAGRQHAIVVERAATGELMLRGIFSATQIGRQLGVDVEPTGQVQSFAELESVLAG